MGGRWLKNMSPEERAIVHADRQAQARARSRQWHAKHRDVDRARRGRKYSANGERLRERARVKYAADPLADRARKLRLKFGLTFTRWLAMFHLQGERCACCGARESGSRFGWHTDHDHITGAVRGIVCEKCNRLLGMLGDHLPRVIDSCARFTRYLEAS